MLVKRTKIILSDGAREKIRKCSSGLTGEEWADIPMDEKKTYISALELALEEIMLTEPDSFTRRAVAHAKEARAKRIARRNARHQADVQKVEVRFED